MAKGNMLLGYARGSVGDVTFYRDGGLQRARARNRRPGNPRSSRQMTQRALFANAVKFNKLAVSKFFKFAFEDKKANESDYNAFMRENLKRGVLISKTAFDTQDYPALGDWILSRGSLAEIFGVGVGDDVATQSMHFPLPCKDVTLSANPTIGEISQALISQAQGQWMVGDIITLVEVTAGKYDVPTATPTPRRYLSNFLLWQIIVDPDDTRAFKSLVQDFYISNQTIDGVTRLCISVGVNEESATEYWQQGLHQAGIIHSRVGDVTQVSRCELVANANYRQALEDAQADSYISAVLADWQASGEAILQGSLADPFDPAPPAVAGLLGVKALKTTGSFSLNNSSVLMPDPSYNTHVGFYALTDGTGAFPRLRVLGIMQGGNVQYSVTPLGDNVYYVSLAVVANESGYDIDVYDVDGKSVQRLTVTQALLEVAYLQSAQAEPQYVWRDEIGRSMTYIADHVSIAVNSASGLTVADLIGWTLYEDADIKVEFIAMQDYGNAQIKATFKHALNVGDEWVIRTVDGYTLNIWTIAVTY